MMVEAGARELPPDIDVGCSRQGESATSSSCRVVPGTFTEELVFSEPEVIPEDVSPRVESSSTLDHQTPLAPPTPRCWRMNRTPSQRGCSFCPCIPGEPRKPPSLANAISRPGGPWLAEGPCPLFPLG